MKILKLTNTERNSPVYVVAEHITSFGAFPAIFADTEEPDGDKIITALMLTSGIEVMVDETPELILEALDSLQ